MEFKELLNFAKAEHQRLLSHFNTNAQELRFPITIKIMEELGELCNDVLAHNNIQRKEKLAAFNKDNLAEEFADVILVTTTLAHNMGVDLEESLKSKMKKIEQRYQK